jgi:hypothetical protein
VLRFQKKKHKTAGVVCDFVAQQAATYAKKEVRAISALDMVSSWFKPIVYST